jgi:hypothetical protein
MNICSSKIFLGSLSLAITEAEGEEEGDGSGEGRERERTPPVAATDLRLWFLRKL